MVISKSSELVIGLTRSEQIMKRVFDIVFSLFGLLLLGWLIVILSIIASIDTRKNGFFLQTRIGKDGKCFKVIKLRTMTSVPSVQTTVTTADDQRITTIGRFLRKAKLDELPQLVNVLLGQMSFVGPRPDVPGFADELTGADRLLLTLRPGITGPATLHFSNEEELLAAQSDPERYNRIVIYPEKVRINLEYLSNYSFSKDLHYIWQTLIRGFFVFH